MSDNTVNLKVCWNCKNYDSFGGVCLYYGIIKQAKDTCNKFDVDQYKETIDGLTNKIVELEEKISRMSAHCAELQKDSDKLQRLECAGVDNWEGYSYAMSYDNDDEED